MTLLDSKIITDVIVKVIVSSLDESFETIKDLKIHLVAAGAVRTVVAFVVVKSTFAFLKLFAITYYITLMLTFTLKFVSVCATLQ